MGVKVRERPEGSGVYWVMIDHQGKRKSKKIGKDKTTANKIARKIEAKLVLGDMEMLEVKPTKQPSFEEYAKCWLEDYIKPLRRPSTHERYRDILERHVFPTLGKKPIDEIKRFEIRNLILKKNKAGLSKSMLCLIRDVISGTMGHAVEDEIIPGNPVSGILKRLKLERDKQITVEPMTEQEVQLFLDTCYQHFREHAEFFLCAFRTGMRLGELLGLKWGDIDWNQKFIRVERSYKRGRIDKTKTGKVRRVDMSDQLATALNQLLTKRKREALKAGLGEPVPYIFHRNQNPMEQNYIRRIFKRVLTKAGIREMRLHDIRHTYASLLLSKGENPVYVKEQLGHSSIKITVDIYGHLIPGSNRGAVNQLDSPQQSATYTQPAKTERPQPIEIAAFNPLMVPKGRLELPLTYVN
jgi:integrase